MCPQEERREVSSKNAQAPRGERREDSDDSRLLEASAVKVLPTMPRAPFLSEAERDFIHNFNECLI